MVEPMWLLAFLIIADARKNRGICSWRENAWTFFDRTDSYALLLTT